MPYTIQVLAYDRTIAETLSGVQVHGTIHQLVKRVDLSMQGQNGVVLLHLVQLDLVDLYLIPLSGVKSGLPLSVESHYEIDRTRLITLSRWTSCLGSLN